MPVMRTVELMELPSTNTESLGSAGLHRACSYIYYPLAKSSGKLYELLKAFKAKDGDRQKKLFQFLNDVGARALRMQLGRVLEMCESSADKGVYEAKIVDRFGGQQELELVTSICPSGPSLPSLQ
jgi:hypothetical protein